MSNWALLSATAASSRDGLARSTRGSTFSFSATMARLTVKASRGSQCGDPSNLAARVSWPAWFGIWSDAWNDPAPMSTSSRSLHRTPLPSKCTATARAPGTTTSNVVCLFPHTAPCTGATSLHRFSRHRGSASGRQMGRSAGGTEWSRLPAALSTFSFIRRTEVDAPPRVAVIRRLYVPGAGMAVRSLMTFLSPYERSHIPNVVALSLATTVLSSESRRSWCSSTPTGAATSRV